MLQTECLTNGNQCNVTDTPMETHTYCLNPVSDSSEYKALGYLQKNQKIYKM